MKKTAKENFEKNIDNIILENISNPKTYWKIMKMLIKSNKGSCNVPPLQNIIDHEDFDEVVFKDDEKCSLLNKYFCMISKLEEENVPLPDFPSKTGEIIENIVTSIQGHS